MVNILVVGGAGFIGSHMVKVLHQLGAKVVALDDLSTGFPDAVEARAELIVGSCGSEEVLEKVFSRYRFDAVIHLASFSQVGESVVEPSRYYRNNVAATLTLLDAMRRFGVTRFVFSSSAAVYGDPIYLPIDEAHPEKPVSPYGRTKLMVEQVLRDYDDAYGIKYVCLRYFNAAGADPSGELGERHSPETHLIPLLLQAASGRIEEVLIFGNDHDTPDGTCIRDYIHVNDICNAHVLALDYLVNVGSSAVFNLGNERGYSVKEVIEAVRRVTGCDIKFRYEARRPGDPSRLVADCIKIRTIMGWRPVYASLDKIISDAWRWENKRPY